MLAYRLAYYRRLAGIGLLHLVASVLVLVLSLFSLSFCLLFFLCTSLSGFAPKLPGVSFLFCLLTLAQTLLNLPGGHCAATLVLLPLFVAGVGYLTYFSVVRSTTLVRRAGFLQQ